MRFTIHVHKTLDIHVCWAKRAEHRSIIWHGVIPTHGRKLRFYSIGWLFVSYLPLPKGH